MEVNVRHDLSDLANDLLASAKSVPKEARKVVNEGARAGNMLARDFARVSAGTHGKHYYKAFTWEPKNRFIGFGSGTYSAEYGPDVARPQGGMATGFEYAVGRQTAPHLDLNRSADIIGPSFAQEVRQMVDRLLW